MSRHEGFEIDEPADLARFDQLHADALARLRSADGFLLMYTREGELGVLSALDRGSPLGRPLAHIAELIHDSLPPYLDELGLTDE